MLAHSCTFLHHALIQLYLIKHMVCHIRSLTGTLSDEANYLLYQTHLPFALSNKEDALSDQLNALLPCFNYIMFYHGLMGFVSLFRPLKGEVRGSLTARLL